MKIGKYEIEEELGRGSMGIVYRARDPLLDRQVAIKLISTENVDELTLPLFEREAKVIARMSHPNIVVVHEYDYFNNEPFIVMEFLKGQDLETAAAADDFNLSKGLRVLHQALSGLGHAHEHEVVHRDIKPTNLFLTESGVVKILDFGVARLASGSTVTEGFILGTPEYMSPEQVKAEALDRRTDLFSMGSVLYWIFTGVTPFSADTAEATMVRIVREEPRPMDNPNLSTPAYTALQSILNRALAKEPADRYATASEMAEQIQSLIDLLESEPESPAEDPEMEYMETIQVPLPKFTTVRKKEKVATPPPSPMRPVEQAIEEKPKPDIDAGESATVIDKTLDMRAAPRPIAVPQAANPREPAPVGKTPGIDQMDHSNMPDEKGRQTSMKLIVLFIVLIAVGIAIIMTQCR